MNVKLSRDLLGSMLKEFPSLKAGTAGKILQHLEALVTAAA